MSTAALGRSLVKVWRGYEHSLRTRPLQTQMVTSTILWGLGDLFAQRIDGKHNHDKLRTLSTAAYGGTVIGPIGHYFYMGMDKVVTRYLKIGTVGFVLAKVLGDELLFGPVHVGGYFAWMTLAEGGSLQDVKHRIQQDFIPTFMAECLYWPFIQGVNFWKVPVKHQLLVVNTACLADSTFLSWAKAQDDWTKDLPLPSFMKGHGKRAIDQTAVDDTGSIAPS